jgi:hypothetical protein
MTQATNNYERLYDNMKNRFTVACDNSEYTLGEYMLMKADAKKADAALPVALRSSATKSEVAVASVASFVTDILTIKEAPAKDKTIKAFPFRASASAFLSAAVACAFLLSFALIGIKATGINEPLKAAVEPTSEVANASAIQE